LIEFIAFENYCIIRYVYGIQFYKKAFSFSEFLFLVVVVLDVKLSVDGEEISLNKFVVKILGGTVVGAVSALRGVKEDWKEIKIEIKR
jgi:hypothetical protein